MVLQSSGVARFHIATVAVMLLEVSVVGVVLSIVLLDFVGEALFGSFCQLVMDGGLFI